MSENLIQEFSRFEEKYKIQEDGQTHFSLEEIDNEDFDVETFISNHFLLSKENNLINYAKLQEAFQMLHEMQGKTLEAIAFSVDSNLESYMDVSRQFEFIKLPLSEINSTFQNLHSLLTQNLRTCQTSSQELNSLILNKEVLDSQEEELSALKEIRTDFLTIQEFLSKPSNFMIIAVSRLFFKMSEGMESISKRFGGKVQGLVEKYRLKELIAQEKQDLMGFLDTKLKEILRKMLGADLETEKKEDLMRFLNSYEILKETKRAETIVQETLIKPSLDSLINSVLSTKSGGVITATKKEFIEKNLSNKIVLFRNIFEGVKAFMQGPYAFFIELQEEKLQKNLIFYGPSYCFVEVLWSSLTKALNSKELSFIFSVGVADSFYLNFLIAEELINEFQSACVKPKSKAFLDEIQAFKSKWNLSTYFYLRNNEIMRSFEKNLRNCLFGINEKIEKGMGGVLKGTNPLLMLFSETMKGCFRKGVYLKALASNFVRTALQIANRFCGFLEHLSKNLNLEENPFTLEKNCFFTNEILKIVESFALGEFSFSEIFEQKEIHQNFIRNLENKLTNTMKTLLSPIIEKFSKSSLENLEPFNGIPAKFRMNLASINVQKPSNFIGNVFKPLQNFLLSNMLAEKNNEMVKKEVLGRVFKSFQSLIQEILKTSQKSEELMTKFISQEKNKESELEKIRQQFRLDFAEMKRLAETKFGYESLLYIQELD